MNANPILLQKKYARVIECFAKKAGITLDKALDFFYKSEVYKLMRDGVSDMHCMSDEYLAEDLQTEYREKAHAKTPIKILFVCHGNICRSAAAEQIMKQLVKTDESEDSFIISSAATSTEEIGNPMYPPMQEVFRKHDMPIGDHRARQITKADAINYDLLICFDSENLYYLHRICGEKYASKIHLLTEYSGQTTEIEDPWYTRDFEKAYSEIKAGCESLYKTILRG